MLSIPPLEQGWAHRCDCHSSRLTYAYVVCMLQHPAHLPTQTLPTQNTVQGREPLISALSAVLQENMYKVENNKQTNKEKTPVAWCTCHKIILGRCSAFDTCLQSAQIEQGDGGTGEAISVCNTWCSYTLIRLLKILWKVSPALLRTGICWLRPNPHRPHCED